MKKIIVLSLLAGSLLIAGNNIQGASDKPAKANISFGDNDSIEEVEDLFADPTNEEDIILETGLEEEISEEDLEEVDSIDLKVDQASSTEEMDPEALKFMKENNINYGNKNPEKNEKMENQEPNYSDKKLSEVKKGPKEVKPMKKTGLHYNKDGKLVGYEEDTDNMGEDLEEIDISTNEMPDLN